MAIMAIYSDTSTEVEGSRTAKTRCKKCGMVIYVDVQHLKRCNGYKCASCGMSVLD